MHSRIRTLWHHTVNVAIVSSFLLSLYLLMQPGSALRSIWEKHQRDAAMRSAVSGDWVNLTRLASSLARSSADVDVIEVADYECPFCRAAVPAVDSAIAAGVRVRYLHLPIKSHQHAEGAALAAICAEEKGHFALMHARLMGTSLWQRDTNWVREARASGITDTTAFLDCMRSPRARTRLEQSVALSDKLQITGTPTFVSLSAVHRGVPSKDALLAMQQPREAGN